MNTTISVYTPGCKAAGQFRRPVNVWVVEYTGEGFHSIRSPNIVRKARIALNVDRRYSGPRSEYGQALARADVVVAEWEHAHA